MTTLDFGPTTTALATLVRGVGDDQLDGPTPNTGRSVGDLLDHIGGLALAFTAAARKEQPPGGGNPTADAGALPEDWRSEIPDRLDALAAAWRDPAAYEGSTQAGPIEMPADAAALVALDEVTIREPDATGVERLEDVVRVLRGDAKHDDVRLGPEERAPLLEASQTGVWGGTRLEVGVEV